MSTSTEVRPRPKHRTFTADQRLTILEEYEAATTPLERAAVMRKRGIYSSLLFHWRKQRDGSTTVSKPKRGRPANPEAAENKRLAAENERLKRRLEKSERTVAALGKAHALLQMIASESVADSERSNQS
jgi:transposase